MKRPALPVSSQTSAAASKGRKMSVRNAGSGMIRLELALFGSYGWGDGEWMRTWEAECLDAGAVLACPSVICQETPDADTLEQCAALAKSLM